MTTHFQIIMAHVKDYKERLFLQRILTCIYFDSIIRRGYVEFSYELRTFVLIGASAVLRKLNFVFSVTSLTTFNRLVVYCQNPGWPILLLFAFAIKIPTFPFSSLRLYFMLHIARSKKKKVNSNKS